MLTITVLIPALLLTSCGVASKVEDFLLGTEEEYRYEDVVHLPMEAVKTLNPALSHDEDTYHITKLIYDGLFLLDEAMVPQKKLVQSYQYYDDGTSLRVVLRRGIEWHDGKKFSAEDVKFSIDLYKQLAKANKGLYTDYVKGIKSVEVEGEYTLAIHYHENNDNNIVNLIFPIVPAHQYGSIGNFIAKGEAKQFKPIGTGRYKVEEYNRLASLTLAANANYYDAKAENTIIFHVLPNKKDAVKLLKAGELSLLYNNTPDRDALVAEADIERLNYISNEAEVIGFNTSKTPFVEKRVRKAIASATDAKTILEKAYYKTGVLSDSILYPGYFGLEGKEEVYPYDLQAAKEYLKNAGYEDRDSDGYVENKAGDEIEIKILVKREDASGTLAASMLKPDLEQLGITVIIDARGDDEYRSMLNSGNYDMFIGGVKINERYDLRPLLHSSYNNIARYQSSRADKYLNTMNAGVDNDQKEKAAVELKKILAEDIPYYCLFYKTYGIFYTDVLQGEPAPNYNYIYRGCEKWSCRY